MCYSDPESHPFLSDNEKDFLEKEMGQLRRKKNQAATPWRLILTSLPVTAICIGQMGFSFTFLTLLSNLPKYMSDVLNFSIRENGLWLSLPYALMFSSAQISGFISDFAINRKYIKITLARKICASICKFIVRWLHFDIVFILFFLFQLYSWILAWYFYDGCFVCSM